MNFRVSNHSVTRAHQARNQFYPKNLEICIQIWGRRIKGPFPLGPWSEGRRSQGPVSARAVVAGAVVTRAGFSKYNFSYIT